MVALSANAFRVSAAFSPTATATKHLSRLASVTSTIPTGSETDSAVLDHMLYRIRECNKVSEDLSLVDFVVDDGVVVGKLRESLALRLSQSSVFSFDAIDKKLTIENCSTPEERTNSVMGAMEELRDEGIINGWRDELLPVVTSFYDSEPAFLIERAAAPHMGTIQYGVHINGFVKDYDTGEIKLWMARRSKTKSKYPGMLDHIVAGGQPFGISLKDNVIKECEEEAGIPLTLAQKAKPVGAVSYEYSETDGQVNRSVLFCYDIELPPDFVPVAVDGEVDEFFLKSISEVLGLMDPNCDDPIKPNCYLVIIDFLLRQGFIAPESPGYLDVLKQLRSGQCV
eukprot:CAMPEP_0196823094 /NCGR_PEP_ID=MMETSP1362-20130617/86122_1 /TAXON_ID=163516 /ORGANISM="Leptocylindrus danicus, Strain CCMP1856" /LENGTH=339 /DNA_ID=CAMNT_0042202857 /DNA_START=272 /DNA_END=1291 /DNA_ORIENTATION=-